MTDFFKNKTVLLTGASDGIGRAMAEILAPLETHLILVSRSEERLRGVADTCMSLGSQTCIISKDLSIAGAAQSLFDDIQQKQLDVDILINNAGSGKGGSFMNFQAEVYERMTTLNVTTPTVLARLFLPQMVERDSGGILNLGSVAGYVPIPLFAAYAATKAYVLSLSESLHAELAKTNVHISCLAPGPVETGFASAADMETVVGGPIANPEEVARVGLEALAGNKRVVLNGLYNRIQTNASKLAPHALSLAVGQRVMRKAGIAEIPLNGNK